MRYSIKWPEYARQWDKMTINKSRQGEFQHIASHVLAYKERYQRVENITGVPWHLVGVLHVRESNCDFDTYLGNGQSIHRRTTMVPRGRGPFKSFEEGAVDALKIDGLTGVKDWRLEKELYWTEAFNGWGYASRGLPSPYVWGGTNQQRAGKYVADGVFNAKVMDTQPGCAPILQVLSKLDPSITLVRET